MYKHIFVIFLGLSFMMGCSFNEPDPPSWDTAAKVYLPLKTVTMEKIVNDSTLLADTTNGQPIIKFELSDSTDWERITRDDLKIEAFSDSFHTEIGTIRLENSEVSSTPIHLDELLDTGAINNDTIPPYPGYTISPDAKELNYDFYNRAVIESGRTYLTFHNELFLTIDSGLTIEVWNNGSEPQTEIARIVFDRPIPPLSTIRSNVVDLSGKEISNHFILKYTIPIKGCDTITVINDQWRNGTCYSVLTVEDLQVSEAEAKVPEQSFSQNESVALPTDQHKLINATVESGSITLNIKNDMALHTQLTVRLPNVLSNGEPKTLYFDLQPNTDVEEVVDLQDCQILNAKNPGAPLDSLDVEFSLTAGSDDQIVTISKNDGMAVEVHTTEIYFRHIAGILNPISQEIASSEVDLQDVFDKISGMGLRMDDLRLSFTFENQIDIPVTTHLTIRAVHQDGGVNEERTMNIETTIQRSSVSPTTTLILDKNYQNPYSIVDLISILPTKIYVSGSALIQGEGSVDVGQGMRALYKIETPISYALSDSLTFAGEVSTIETSDNDLQESLSEDVHELTLHLSMHNGTPLGALIKVIFSDDSLQLNSEAIADSSRKIVIKIPIAAGAVDQNGYVIQPTQNETDIHLTHDQLQLFNQPVVYLKQWITLLPTNGKKVMLRTSDSIGLDGYLYVKYRIHTK